MSNIPINSGTGPGVAVDLVGTDNYQVVKIMQAVAGNSASLSTLLTITGSVGIAGTPAVTAANVTIASIATGTVNVVNVLSASNVTVASLTTGTVNVVNTVAVTQPTQNIKMAYVASTAPTITLTTLAASSARQSTAFVNTASNYLDGGMLIALKTTSGTHGADLVAYCHFYASPDGVNWTNPITSGTDALVTISTGMNLYGPAVINFGTSVTGLYAATRVIASIASIFGGQLPQQWGVVIENKVGLAFTNVGGDQVVNFYPTYQTIGTT